MATIGYAKPPKDDSTVVIANIDVRSLRSLPDGDRRYYMVYEVFYDEREVQIYRGDGEDALELVEFKELYPLKSMTQVTAPTLMDGELVSYINMPIDLYLKLPGGGSSEARPSQRHFVKVLFEIYSLDSWEINRYQGYGILSVELAPGCYAKKVQVHKPKQSLSQQIRDYFIGGNYHIKNKKGFAFETNRDEHHEANFYNRIVEFSCEIDLSVSVCRFSSGIKQSKRKEHQDALIKREVLKNKVDLQN